ncbi:5,6-dimethylbenzimidazole synthase [Ferriphaselus amnicola]|uniref:5,6-dimethylbenzimidazole synthase n=1 Tax=Ferriphaselus amnicola TaxID=1188319 RepID=A0A2Z6GBU4_9PROT|nr:5,6-dimethylbenzimidazole synthase [Ferriphaselus amnicola]BBE50849.1 5,6-dimethylbenzimidazole synthase [Ferriphaselus amnicola]
MTHRYSDSERAAIYRVIAERRDMRHFCGSDIPAATLQRILQAAHQAPSVGLMQPWRFIRISDGALRERIYQLVAAERHLTAQEMGERDAEFLRLKVEGVRDCAELLVAVLAPDDGTLFGRRTLPEMDLASVACAIQNLWLAARAEGLGMGWVSLFEPLALARLLNVPAGGKPIAILCLGQVEAFYTAPMLQLQGWRDAQPLANLLFENQWDERAA